MQVNQLHQGHILKNSAMFSFFILTSNNMILTKGALHHTKCYV